MNSKFISLITISLLCLFLLVFSATVSSSKPVVTVKRLLSQKEELPAIRLGARVTEKKVSYETEPVFLLEFWVQDIPSKDNPSKNNSYIKDAEAEVVQSSSPSSGSPSIKVIYQGLKPDTFQAGRDVILEGSWSGEEFYAETLMTQCPSKYEPPSGPS